MASSERSKKYQEMKIGLLLEVLQEDCGPNSPTTQKLSFDTKMALKGMKKQSIFYLLNRMTDDKR